MMENSGTEKTVTTQLFNGKIDGPQMSTSLDANCPMYVIFPVFPVLFHTSGEGCLSGRHVSVTLIID